MRNLIETRKQIVAMYERGDRIDDIESTLGVSRSSIYYALDRAGVAPARAKQKRRLKGTEEDLRALYELLEQMESYNAVLAETLEAHGIEIPGGVWPMR